MQNENPELYSLKKEEEEETYSNNYTPSADLLRGGVYSTRSLKKMLKADVLRLGRSKGLKCDVENGEWATKKNMIAKLLDYQLKTSGITDEQAEKMQKENMEQNMKSLKKKEEEELEEGQEQAFDWGNPGVKGGIASVRNGWHLMQFDGASKGNPGPAGCGYVIYKLKGTVDKDYAIGLLRKDGRLLSRLPRKEVATGYHYLGAVYTNNDAEYAGLLMGLKAAQVLGVKHLLVEGDSNLTVQQIVGNYRVVAPKLVKVHAECKHLMSNFKNFHIHYIKRVENAKADEQANIAVKTKSSEHSREELRGL